MPAGQSATREYMKLIPEYIYDQHKRFIKNFGVGVELKMKKLSLEYKVPDQVLTAETPLKDTSKSYNLYQRVQAWIPLQSENTTNEEVLDLLRYC